jgi:uncharacterized protein (DUF1778 family)
MNGASWYYRFDYCKYIYQICTEFFRKFELLKSHIMDRALNTDKTRFDTKLTKVQKDLFELAAKIGGYRTLTDFVVTTVQEKAKNIVEQHEAILLSERDKNIFFDAIMNPPKPNQRLQEAAKRYKDLSNQSA